MDRTLVELEAIVAPLAGTAARRMCNFLDALPSEFVDAAAPSLSLPEVTQLVKELRP